MTEREMIFKLNKLCLRLGGIIVKCLIDIPPLDKEEIRKNQELFIEVNKYLEGKN